MIIKKILYGCESRGDARSPSLTRWTLLKTRRGSLCLHKFHRSDADTHHDHPWGFWSLILWRGYVEETPLGRRSVRPGRLLFRSATWRHRVILHSRGGRELPAVTLVWAGPRVRNWGFFTKRGWQQWREYFAENGC